MFMSFIDKFKLRKDYVYEGNIDQLENKLTSISQVTVAKTSSSEYNIESTGSVGILFVNNIPLTGINVTAKIVESTSTNQRLLFTTKMRVEHYFISIICLFLVFVAISKHEPIITLLSLLVIWILCVFFFQWIYRMQEEALLTKIIRVLES